MAADLASTPTSGLRVQACGDAHLMNFGGFATPERNIFFDINDFDETLPAPWEWDVKRLAASFVIAASYQPARQRGGEGGDGSVYSYRERMADYASMRALDVWYDRIDLDGVLKVLPTGAEVERVRQKSRAGAPEKRARKPVPEAGRAFRLGAEDQGRAAADLPPHRGAGPGRQERIRRGARRISEVVARAYSRAVRPFQLFDLAIKVVGVGSVGTYCALGLFMAADDDPIFLQVKEARRSVLEPYAGNPAHEPRPAGGGRPASHAGGERHFPWLDARTDWARLLLPPASGRENLGVSGDWDVTTLKEFGNSRRALARAHARSATSEIAGYMGSNTTFDDAVCEFAVEYADQNLRDYRGFVKAIREDRIPVASED